ncbi:MAG TPA: type II toxin-antitoxin system VapC family toxin [Desulfobacteraceae bacterium]|nr:type II toxin-antitoxin system VapC family toxin [Deltaproteobacteria bacterium]MBW2356350.1 type II toxin-antitoxin system VapC family toxin [Deltaproteobacteria bacterium]RLB94490.1 MAG: type II toxin-antitoxin system VapC family toxin [Deltaproteobacteria bacterium]HDI60063.1 type II toxin-antitoxin system VapC family toxin [Desulfobacteraceae bacterium]
MGIILDTSVLIEAEKGRFDVKAFISGRESFPFGISAVTVSELLHGVYRADSEARKRHRSAFVEKVIDIFPVFIFDTQVARIYADIWASLQKKGVIIGAHDMMIGATAIANGFSVATFNPRYFSRIAGLRLEILSYT